MNKPDRSKIQNLGDYAMNKQSSSTNPSFTSPSMNIVPTQNKFTVLGNFPPLPSKLATFAQTTSSSSKDHSSSKSDNISSPCPAPIIPIFAQPSQVLHKYKSVQPKLFPIELEYRHMKNAGELVTKVFPPGWDFMPEEKNKSQKFYEFILVDSGSFILSHTPSKFDPEHKRIVFSKCTIKNVLSPARWNYSPWQGRKFSQPFDPQIYNYFDY
jgi:hypothetical protein